MEEKIRYRATLSANAFDWENNDPILLQQVISTYLDLIYTNKLNPHNYTPLLSFEYLNEDFVQNRLTLILEAAPVNKLGSDLRNYKDLTK